MKKTKIAIVLSSILIVMSLLCFGGCGCKHENKVMLSDSSNCETAGIIQYECLDCGKIIESEGSALGHDYSVFVSDSATCTSSGKVTKKCSRCEETTEEYSPKKEHEFDGYFCKMCGTVKSEYTKYKINSSMFDLENFYTGSWGSVMISLEAETGKTGIEFTAFAQAKYSKIIYYTITLVNKTKKTGECVIVGSKYATGNSITTISNKSTLKNPYNPNDEYYIKVLIS